LKYSDDVRQGRNGALYIEYLNLIWNLRSKVVTGSPLIINDMEFIYFLQFFGSVFLYIFWRRIIADFFQFDWSCNLYKIPSFFPKKRSDSECMILNEWNECNVCFMLLFLLLLVCGNEELSTTEPVVVFDFVEWFLLLFLWSIPFIAHWHWCLMDVTSSDCTIVI